MFLLAMHMANELLSIPVAAATLALTALLVALAAGVARRTLNPERLPLMGVMGAFVFAAQMINFPVGPGTSGHLVGGALLAATLGPSPAAIVMTSILALQALVFQDGGILCLGANVFNMAIAGVLAGYFPFRMLAGSAGRSVSRKSLGLFLGGFLSVMVSACLAMSQLMLSGVKMPAGVLGVSVGLFVISAALEGAITVAVVQAIDRLNPTWIPAPAAAPRRTTGLIGVCAILLAAVGILVVSASPDTIAGLVGQLGFAGQAKANAQALFVAPLADYQIKGLPSEYLRKAAAGFCGLALIYGACLAWGRLLRRRAAPGV
jgi:cobalt/nickel transport system permease protein